MQLSTATTGYPSVYIILLTYQMREVAERCLSSLERLTYPNRRIVLVDNNSGDGIELMVKSRFPEVTALQTGQNLGYTGGNNFGIRYALENGAEYVLVLNPDTIVANPGFIEEMAAYAEANPRVGIMGPRVFLRERETVQNTVLFAPGLWTNIKNWVAYRINPGAFDLSKEAAVEAEVLNGVCLLLRADCLRQIGLFDHNIFMYIEDAEMDHRARLHGWSVRYVPIDSVIHEQKREGYHMTGMVSFLLRRNSVYYLCKVGKPGEAWGYAILSLLLLGIRAVATFSRKGFIDYTRFCQKLAAAYMLILLNRPLDSSFGPPFEQK
ncbi:MAG: glycosyltransferase family 2 protein [Acidobacteriota bacterium]